MTFPSRPTIGPKDKVVAHKCLRKPPCDSMQAIVRQPRAGVTQFICIKCGHTTGVAQGSNVNL